MEWGTSLGEWGIFVVERSTFVDKTGAPAVEKETFAVEEDEDTLTVEWVISGVE